MSDDIVTRLRNIYTLGQLGVVHEAADEIEELRLEVSRLMQIICDASPDDDYLLVRRESDAMNRVDKGGEW